MSGTGEEDASPARFREELAVRSGTEPDSHSGVDSGFIDRIRSQHSGRWGAHRIEESVERIETGESLNCGACELLRAMVQPATANRIDIEAAMRSKVNNGIRSRGEYIDVSSRHANIIQDSRFNAHRIIIHLQFQADSRIEVITDAALNVPPHVQVIRTHIDRCSKAGAKI